MMKKCALLLSCSLLYATAAFAVSTEDQLKTMKSMYLKEFQEIDSNYDGVISQDEYLAHQFKAFRNNMLHADSFDVKEEKTTTPATAKISDETPKPITVKKEEIELGGVPVALKDMAEFDIDLDDLSTDDLDLSIDDEAIFGYTETNKEDDKDALYTSDGKKIDLPEIDLDISEEESLKNLLNKMENPAEPEKPKVSPEERNEQINFMMETIKKTLPKKIDNMTTWTDIIYQNGTIAYIYQASVDTSNFSNQEKQALKDEIEQQACVQAYIQMCPRIKSMFINEGINMEIRYLDKKERELSSCEFNRETCKKY